MTIVLGWSLVLLGAVYANRSGRWGGLPVVLVAAGFALALIPILVRG